MSLPSLESFEDFDYKHAFSVLRHRIQSASLKNLQRDEQHIRSAISILRRRLTEKSELPPLPVPPVKLRTQPEGYKFSESEHVEVRRLIDAFEKLYNATHSRRNRKELRVEYARSIKNAFFEVATPPEVAEYHEVEASIIAWKKEERKYSRDMGRYRALQRRHKEGADHVDSKNHIRHKSLDNIERDLRLKVSGATGAPKVSGKVSWELLPKGALGLSELNDFVQEHGITQRKGFEAERLNFAYQLNPQSVYVGRSEFDGYFVFLFDETGKVLLENPFHGNAAFVFHTDWKALSKLSRTDLTLHYKGKVDRIIHSGPANSWKQSIRRSLKLNLNLQKTT